MTRAVQRTRILLACVVASVACGVEAPAPLPKFVVTTSDITSVRGHAGSEEIADAVPTVGVAAPITLDGRFQDWTGLTAAVVDPAGDAGLSGIDLRTLRLANDGEMLFIDLDTTVEIELDWGHGLSLFIDCDGPPSTGRWIRWDMGLRRGVLVGEDREEELSFADLGFVAAPTTTGSRFEMTLARAALMDLLGACAMDAVRVRFEDRTAGGDALPDKAWIRYYFSGEEIQPRSLPEFERSLDTIRIVTWNVLWSGIVDPAMEPQFRRVLQALEPDIIAFQEILEHGETHALVESWFPNEHWEYAGYGDRITLGRFPRLWDWPGSYAPLDSRFTVAGFAMPGGEMLAVFNAHMSFGDQDAERQQEADSFIAYLRDLQTPGGAVDMPPGTPFVLTGDLNLVGDRSQLDTLLTGDIHDTDAFGPPHAPDWDGSDLADLFPLQAGRAFAYTWRDDGGSFWPGKLDYMIIPDSVLGVAQQFVLDTTILSDEVLTTHGLERHDTDVSDHLPVVVDFSIK